MGKEVLELVSVDIDRSHGMEPELLKGKIWQ
jgi:hypothetical protein